MTKRPPTSYPLLAFHFIVAVFCLWNVFSIPDRARVPFETNVQGDDTYVARIADEGRAADLQQGDRLDAWKGIPIAMPEHLELLADLSAVGDRIPLTILRGDERYVRTVELVPFYPSYRFAVVTAFAGMTILLFGVFLYLKRPGDPTTLLLHWALMSLGVVTLMTQSAVGSDSILSFARRSLLFLSYNLTAAFFLLFTLRFPRRILPRTRGMTFLFISPFFGLAGYLSWYHIASMQTGDPEVFRTFQSSYDVFHFVFLVALALGIVFICVGYVRERLPERRQALRWISYGLLVGATPYLLLVVLPQLWGPDLLVAEELATFFTLAIPLSFIVAFLRYHVFSIEIQHRQRLTAFLLRTSLSLLQILFVAIVLSIFWEDIIFGSHVVEVLIFGLTLVLLSPVRSGLARLIEEAIFPARFNPARLLQDVSSRFHGLLVAEDVGPLLIAELHHIIPRFTFLWYPWNGRTLQRGRSSDLSFLPKISLSPMVIDDLRLGRCIIRPDALRPPDHSTSPPQSAWLSKHGLSFANPVLDESALSLGILFGKRNDGSDPLDRGEFELVQTLCLQAAAVSEHLRLMEKMILEQRKRREIEELSRLKSHFVASVSHDLRTPLTSMSMFLELLDTPRLPAKDRNEYVGLIRQEAERLRQLVENVLDFARAERGIKEFTLESVELSPLLRQAADAMSGRFKAVGAEYTTRIPARLPRVLADAQALERAFVNLLSNAYKYTPQKKKVSFTVRKRDSTVQIDIVDNGFGIAEDELPNIFDPFYRVRDAATSSTGGVGLGLSLVKRTIEQHNGLISVRSRKGKGTTVTVELPIHQPKA